MKIYVVNYDELNKRKTDAEVVADLVKFWDEATIKTREEMGSFLRETLSRLAEGAAYDIAWDDTTDVRLRQLIPSRIREASPDVLVTYNLAGFELTTLTDGLGYNLVSCRQIHFVEKDSLPNEVYLQKDRSINIFIVKKSTVC